MRVLRGDRVAVISAEFNVIDVGCAHYGGPDSTEYILEEYPGRFAIALDPNVASHCYFHGQTFVARLRVAAWTESRTMRYRNAGLGGFIDDHPVAGVEVETVDLAALVRAFAPVILKIDAEGSEYPLLEHLMAERVDDLVQLAWIEWHKSGPDWAERKAAIKKGWRGDMAVWRL